MSFDKSLFGRKLTLRREALGLVASELSGQTGLSVSHLGDLEAGREEPTGDEVLILASALTVDFRFFMSSDKEVPDDKVDVLFRRYGSDVDAASRRAIVELLYLCATEHMVQSLLGRTASSSPQVKTSGTYYKAHGVQAANQVRLDLGLSAEEAIGDVFALARRLGTHVFRRRLPTAEISGLTVHHREAGPCIVVNLGEDPYRQRFTLAHELAHALLDSDQEVVISFTKWDRNDLLEIRANSFAGHLLAPTPLLVRLKGPDTDENFVRMAHRLEVNALTLAIQMREAGIIDRERYAALSRVRIPMREKPDPELPTSLSPGQRARKSSLIERGLSDHYVNLCLDAYGANLVSFGRLTEALLTDERGVRQIVGLYGRRLHHDA